MEESAKTELKSKYEKMTGEDLRRENKRLKAQLDKINMRVTSYYEKSLIKINNKTTNGRLSHDLNISQLVFQSEMKNSENYKQYLGREKVKLESILTKSVNRRQKNVEEEIREEKTKMKSIKKENKENQLNIMKNGSTLTTNKITTCEQIFTDLQQKLQTTLQENQSKKSKLVEIQKRTQELKAKNDELKQSLGYMDEEKDDKQEKELQKLLKYLKSKRDILAANIKSINQRWNQEYCWKLKQMNELKSSIKECDEKYTLVNSKNEELKNEKQSNPKTQQINDKNFEES